MATDTKLTSSISDAAHPHHHLSLLALVKSETAESNACHTTTSITDTNTHETTTGSFSKSGDFSNYPLDFSIKQITSNTSIVNSNYHCLHNKEMEGNNFQRVGSKPIDYSSTYVHDNVDDPRKNSNNESKDVVLKICVEENQKFLERVSKAPCRKSTNPFSIESLIRIQTQEKYSAIGQNNVF